MRSNPDMAGDAGRIAHGARPDGLDGAFDVGHVRDERLDEGPPGNRREQPRDHENEPVLVIPLPAGVAGDPGFAAETGLAPQQVINMGAVGVGRGDAQDRVGIGSVWLCHGNPFLRW